MEREMTIQEVMEICGENWKNNLDNIIQALLYFKEREEKVYYNFNGHILHSENITYNSAYIEVTGRPKEREITSQEVMKICGEDWKNNLDNIIQALLYFKEKGESVCYIFNGHVLHSDDITYDSAYIEVTGKTKEEDDKTGGQKKR